MGGGMRLAQQKAAFAAAAISLGLHGCVAAAAVPLLVATGAVTGFTAYKTIQLTSGGGTYKVSFRGTNGKDAPLVPLPPARKVAVWPGEEHDVMFAQKLSESRRFEVSSPAAVSGILASRRITADRKQLTQAEQTEAFAVVCGETGADLIFATRALSMTTSANTFSLSRPNITYEGELLGFSCAMRSDVWREQVMIVVELGARYTPPSAEMNEATAQALADRVVEAQDLGSRQVRSS